MLLLSLALATILELSHGQVLRIAVTGDTGSDAEAVARGIAAVHAERPVDAIILTGDNFYPCGVTSVDDPRWSINVPLTRIGVPIFPVLGNHDLCGKADPEAQVRATGVVPNWRFPARAYVVATPLADLAFLDTNEGAVSFPPSTKPWQIAVGHHPILSSGYHGYLPRRDVKRMRKLVPAFRAAGIDLYICGHDHHLELIRGSMSYLVSGAGSEPIPPVKLRLRTVYPERVGRETIGFALLEVTRTELRVRFYGADGKPKSEWLSAGVRRDPVPE